MARRTRKSAASAGRASSPSVEARQGKRGVDEHGNVRPADGRWDLVNAGPEDDQEENDA